jgi:hypothetical protein
MSPDERFILFDSWRTGGVGLADLYMCVRHDDGSWSEAIHLPAGVNTAGGNICASLLPDGRYLFFTAKWDIYWVSTELLDNLIPAKD